MFGTTLTQRSQAWERKVFCSFEVGVVDEANGSLVNVCASSTRECNFFFPRKSIDRILDSQFVFGRFCLCLPSDFSSHASILREFILVELVNQLESLEISF